MDVKWKCSFVSYSDLIILSMFWCLVWDKPKKANNIIWPIRDIIPVVMCGCESWTIKKVECQRTDAFEQVLEKTLESPLDYREIKPVNPKGNQSWIFIGRTDAKAEAPILWPPDQELTHWKSPWCWERLKAGGEGDNRGRDGWMASLSQWTWIWASSRSWWWTGKPGMLQSMGLQRIEYDWAIELNWTEGCYFPTVQTLSFD